MDGGWREGGSGLGRVLVGDQWGRVWKARIAGLLQNQILGDFGLLCFVRIWIKLGFRVPRVKTRQE